MLELCSATAAANFFAMRQIISGGFDVNTSDFNQRSALHVAAAKGVVPSIAFLLDKGANPDCIDCFGITPLFEAVRGGHLDAADMVYKAGGSLGLVLPDTKTAGSTSKLRRHPGELMCQTVAAGDAKFLDRLLRFGLPVNSADYDGSTGLHLAAGAGRVDIVQKLLSHGAFPSPVDRSGRTPLLEALRANQEPCARLIFTAGGKLEFLESTIVLRKTEKARVQLIEKELIAVEKAMVENFEKQMAKAKAGEGEGDREAELGAAGRGLHAISGDSADELADPSEGLWGVVGGNDEDNQEGGEELNAFKRGRNAPAPVPVSVPVPVPPPQVALRNTGLRIVVDNIEGDGDPFPGAHRRSLASENNNDDNTGHSGPKSMGPAKKRKSFMSQLAASSHHTMLNGYGAPPSTSVPPASASTPQSPALVPPPSMKTRIFAGLELCLAASEGETAYMRLLLRFGCPPNAGDYDMRTAAHICCCENNIAAATVLFEFKADFHSDKVSVGVGEFAFSPPRHLS